MPQLRLATLQSRAVSTGAPCIPLPTPIHPRTSGPAAVMCASILPPGVPLLLPAPVPTPISIAIPVVFTTPPVSSPLIRPVPVSVVATAPGPAIPTPVISLSPVASFTASPMRIPSWPPLVPAPPRAVERSPHLPFPIFCLLHVALFLVRAPLRFLLERYSLLHTRHRRFRTHVRRPPHEAHVHPQVASNKNAVEQQKKSTMHSAKINQIA